MLQALTREAISINTKKRLARQVRKGKLNLNISTPIVASFHPGNRPSITPFHLVAQTDFVVQIVGFTGFDNNVAAG